jgi:hypothetical protein
VPYDERDEDTVLAYTLRERRRIDRLERAVVGYQDEGGAWVPGLLQNTADVVVVARRVKSAIYALVVLAVINSLHLFGLGDIVKTWFEAHHV